PITSVYAIHEGLRIVLEEGLENRFARHRRNYKALRAGLEALGMRYVAPDAHQLPQLHAVYLPAGITEELPVRKRLLETFGIEIGGGLGELKGKIWRIGLMGCNSRADVVYSLLGALERVLSEAGLGIAPGAGTVAAQKAYSAAG
ncbi:MAG: alanine--glyoxylate aminotransferase family protein, partial [Planctomycetota bacterium]